MLYFSVWEYLLTVFILREGVMMTKLPDPCNPWLSIAPYDRDTLWGRKDGQLSVLPVLAAKGGLGRN